MSRITHLKGFLQPSPQSHDTTATATSSRLTGLNLNLTDMLCDLLVLLSVALCCLLHLLCFAVICHALLCFVLTAWLGSRCCACFAWLVLCCFDWFCLCFIFSGTHVLAPVLSTTSTFLPSLTCRKALPRTSLKRRCSPHTPSLVVRASEVHTSGKGTILHANPKSGQCPWHSWRRPAPSQEEESFVCGRPPHATGGLDGATAPSRDYYPRRCSATGVLPSCAPAMAAYY